MLCIMAHIDTPPIKPRYLLRIGDRHACLYFGSECRTIMRPKDGCLFGMRASDLSCVIEWQNPFLFRSEAKGIATAKQGYRYCTPRSVPYLISIPLTVLHADPALYLRISLLCHEMVCDGKVRKFRSEHKENGLPHELLTLEVAAVKLRKHVRDMSQETLVCKVCYCDGGHARKACCWASREKPLTTLAWNSTIKEAGRLAENS